MFHAPCPHCGASVQLASSASLFAVCGYCHSALARDGEALLRIGEMSEVLEDYSPLQLGAAGAYEKRPFTVVGRLQMRYPGGWWNEWFLVHPDGTHGWLSDASGQYALMHEAALEGVAPDFDTLVPGAFVRLSGVTFEVSDKRVCAPHAVQGELPFALNEHWEARVIDLRNGDQLATLDYSDGAPVLYRGTMVELPRLDMQLLRDPQAIAESAGRIAKTLDSLACPTCGHGLEAVPAGTPFGVCPGCGSALDLTSNTAQLLEQGRRAGAKMLDTTLHLGEAGTLNGARFTVIGVTVSDAYIEEEYTRWTDYLLYAPKEGFRWLSESSTGEWLESRVCDTWPVLEDGSPKLGQTRFRQDCAYAANVIYVAGSFNWRVARGDKTRCVEYLGQGGQHSKTILLCESTDDERSWTLCQPVPASKIRKAFGLDAVRVPNERAAAADPGSLLAPLTTALVGHLLLWLANPGWIGFIVSLGTVGYLGWMAHYLMEQKK